MMMSKPLDIEILKDAMERVMRRGQARGAVVMGCSHYWNGEPFSGEGDGIRLCKDCFEKLKNVKDTESDT